MMGDLDSYPLHAIGIVRSPLKDLDNAPNQGSEGAPDARIELAPSVQDGLDRIEAGDGACPT
jgi:tRNA (Thr-GGU) A37 N-methylase